MQRGGHSSAVPGPVPQGFFRIIKNQGGGGPLPQNPLPPSPDQIWSGHFWYTKFWVQNPLPPSPPLLKRSPAVPHWVPLNSPHD